MKRLLSLLVLTASLLAPRAARAQNPLGTVVANYSYTVSKLLADPARARVYITDTTSNSVIVLDTTTLQAMATVLVGSHPVDLAISPDGNTLYVANGGSTLSAIVLLDLDTLTVRGTFPLANAPVAIAAGQGGRLYVSASPDSFSTAIYQLDAATGAVQTAFNGGENGDNNLLGISPDGRTLYAVNNATDPGVLASFDVSTATPVAVQVNRRVGQTPPELVVSHQGKYLCLPGYSDVTYLYSTADITAYYGSFANAGGNGGGPLVFSPDDSLVYHVVGSDVEVFDTNAFTESASAPLPAASAFGDAGVVKQMVIDHTGSYLFVGAISYTSTPANSGQLTVIATGAGTLAAPSIVPVITGTLAVSATEGVPFTYQITASNQPTSYVASSSLPDGLNLDPTTGLISGTPTETGTFTVALQATNLGGTGTGSLTITVATAMPTVTLTAPNYSITAGGDDVGEFTVTLSEVQDHDVVVNFTVRGSAVNGTDYALFKGTKKIKAGHTSKFIRIVPQGDLEGASRKVVALSLAPGDGYVMGTTGKVKVKILAPVE